MAAEGLWPPLFSHGFQAHGNEEWRLGSPVQEKPSGQVCLHKAHSWKGLPQAQSWDDHCHQPRNAGSKPANQPGMHVHAQVQRYQPTCCGNPERRNKNVCMRSVGTPKTYSKTYSKPLPKKKNKQITSPWRGPHNPGSEQDSSCQR